MPEPDNNLTPGQEGDAVALYLAAARERWNTAANGKWEDYATALELLSSALRSAADVPRLLGAVEKVLALCRDTDGNYLPGESSIPVGEFVAAITAELLREVPADGS